MKVNITGKGVIPGINQLAPVYNQELEKTQVRRILNYPNLKVYGTDGIGLITKNNIDAAFSVKPKNERPLAATKAKIKPEPVQAPKIDLDTIDAVPYPEVDPQSFPLMTDGEIVPDDVEDTAAPLPEITEDPVVEEATYEPAVEEVMEDVPDDTISADTTAVEVVKPYYNRNKKKNKNRHNNNN